MHQISEENLNRILAVIKKMAAKIQNVPEPMRSMALADPDIKELIVSSTALEAEIKNGANRPAEQARVWTQASGKHQCFWQGAHGRCVYEFGHFGPHAEYEPAKE